MAAALRKCTTCSPRHPRSRRPQAAASPASVGSTLGTTQVCLDAPDNREADNVLTVSYMHCQGTLHSPGPRQTAEFLRLVFISLTAGPTSSPAPRQGCAGMAGSDLEYAVEQLKTPRWGLFSCFCVGPMHHHTRLLVPRALLQEECEGNQCNPQLGDLMVGRAAQLSASSTCGLDGPQKYCIIGYLEDGQKCFTCDSTGPYNRYNNPNSHRIENTITTFEPERTMKWWQSENGVQRVSIRLDLETLFQFSHLVLTFKSFRPAAMLVERSKDYGRTWKVFRYFAEDCALHFPWVSAEPADSVDDVVCDSKYSGPEPSTDGEVVLKALDPRFDIQDPYAPHIQELITITNMRINFTSLFTLGDIQLGRQRRNPQDKYYYALYEMVVRGSCFCNSHAAQCQPVGGSRGDVFNEVGMVHGRCLCEHNTVGDNCERCQDFYNDAPWRPGGHSDESFCRRCNCHGHSESCHFDMVRYEASGRVSGGVCDDCRDNRMGPQCELCRPGLYQDPRLSVQDPQGCIPCDCDPVGSLDNGQCDPVTGRCVCKENVDGQRCDRCKYGYYGFRQEDPLGCQRCPCNSLGSLQTPHPCDQETGQCVCEPFATGALCDQCLPGYWGLGNTPYKCSPCACDIGGAYNSICSSSDGQCQCLPNMVGRSCSDPAPGYFLAPLDYFLFEAENAAPLPGQDSSSLVNPSVLPKCEQYYREQGYDFKFINGRVVLTRARRQARRRRRQGQRSIPLEPGSALQIAPRASQFTWTGAGFVRVLDGAGLRFTVDSLPASLDYQLVIRYEPESPSDWTALVSIVPLSPGDGGCPGDPTGSKDLILPGNTRAAILDSPVCLNANGRYYVDITFRKRDDGDPTPTTHILIDSMGLIPKMESVQDFCSQSELDLFKRFRCVELAAELGQQQTLPEQCESLIGSMSARINNGAIACRCNVQGSVGTSCCKFGGKCTCKPHVIGRCCDSCAPLTYGFGPEGCKPCECDMQGSVLELCDQVRGQCPCRREVAGRRCDRCQPGYWGFPLCRPCECNGLAELCDQDTGVCLDCRGHSTGSNCERCEEGYSGDPVSRDPCEACLCPDNLASGRYFASSCSKNGSLTCNCLYGHTGSRCDTCIAGFYGDLSLDGARCQECPCNNNIDPDDCGACDSVTGECLRCLHNTQGPRCQHCKPGHYGDALAQDCKACLCDRQGTEVTQCPLGSPCSCDPQTGQCPCRTGAVGLFCDACADGYWNIRGASGCQLCKCDPANSLDKICDKVTGQCKCSPEFGGRQCDECGENYFGNPDLECLPCDCDMEGTEQPACDPFTGECLCRDGVMGVFCDLCAPGYDSTFPACAPCHPCATLWSENVTDVRRAAKRMRTFIPQLSNHLQPSSDLRWRKMLVLHSKLDDLVNLTAQSLPQVEELEKLFRKIGKLKDSIDTNIILIDVSPLMDTQIENIRLEFKLLMDQLLEKISKAPKVDLEELEDALEDIKDLYNHFTASEKRVKKAEKALEDSMNTRQEIKEKLASCGSKGDFGPLEKKIDALSVAKLNEDICGAPGDTECSKSECGGALCLDALGKKECGGPNCKGSVPVSTNATETAEQTEKDIVDLKHKLRNSQIKINDAKQMSLDTQEQVEELIKKMTDQKEKFEMDKEEIKNVIKLAKDFLTDERMAPNDVDKLAMAVLAIQLPLSPDAIRSMIKNIKDLLSDLPDVKADAKDLEEQAKTAKDLLDQALDLKNRVSNIDVSEIKKDIAAAEKAQDKASDDLKDAQDNKDMFMDQLKDIAKIQDNTESKLNSTNLQAMINEIDALKRKTEMNRAQAAGAKAEADVALDDAAEAATALNEVQEQFDVLKERAANHTNQDTANQRLTNIKMEAEKLKKEVENKIQLVDELEKRIKDLILSKEDKAKEVELLMKEVEQLRDQLLTRAEYYIICKS
ncbi:laminin subunit beta-4 [Aplochiton taeniatus]